MKYQRKPYHSENHNDFILQPDPDGQWLAEETPCCILSVNGGGEVRWEVLFSDVAQNTEDLEVIRHFNVTSRKGKHLYDQIEEGIEFTLKGKALRVREKFDSPGGTGTGWNVVLQVKQDGRWLDYCRANTLNELENIAEAINS